MSGEAEAAPAGSARAWIVHGGLFALTCATTTLSGGPAFAATLMTILVCHEMGHYVVARRHGIDASLPYFIPLPPMISLGTMGAVIRMRSRIESRDQLIDVGASGPLAGLVVAVPLLVWGLARSPVVADPAPGGLIEGNSLAYLGLKYLVTGRILPAADGADVSLHPMAFAAWVGMLITMINLIPIGQLDGGHVARGYLGDRHERMSGWLHRGLFTVGAAVAAWMASEGRAAGLEVGDALAHGAWAGAPWMVWGVLLGGMRRLGGGAYHPTVGDTPPTRGRRALVAVTAAVFILLFTPVPLRESLGG